MTHTHTHDVVVVGASIAGCATATFFARAGARVALVERSPDPDAYKVACTHFLLASAVPVLDRLGVTAAMRAAGAVPNDIHIHTRWGWLRAPLEHEGAGRGYNLRRSVLDPLLRRTAAAEPGVDLLLGHTVERLRHSGGRVDGVVARTKTGERIELRAPLVVGADGRGSRTAQLAELPAHVKPHGRFNFFAHFRDLELATGSTSQMWLREPDVAYTFPNDDGVTVACVMPALERLPEYRADMLGSFLRDFRGPARRTGPRERQADLADHGQGRAAERLAPGVRAGDRARRRRGAGVRPAVGPGLLVRAAGGRDAGRGRGRGARARRPAPAGPRARALPPRAPAPLRRAPLPDGRLLDRPPVQRDRPAHPPLRRGGRPLRRPLRGLRRADDRRHAHPLPRGADARRVGDLTEQASPPAGGGRRGGR